MITFTVADIVSAQANDLTATQRIMDALLPVIDNIARKMAAEVTARTSDLAEDLASEGRLELWRIIAEHDGNERHGSGWLVKSVQAEMLSARNRLMNPGASDWEVATYRACLKKTDYDGAAALRMATSLPAGKRLSPAAAYAAQIACDGTASLDAPAHEGLTLLDSISDEPYSAPEESWNLPDRIAAVHETLDAMAPAQAEVVMRLNGYEQSWDEIAEAMGGDKRNLMRSKDRSEKNFYARFPWERVYPGPKPALNTNRDSRMK